MSNIRNNLKINKLEKAVLCVLLICLTFSACRNPEDISGTLVPTITAAVQTTAPSETFEPVKGGTLQIPMPASPKSYHPLFLSESEMSNVYSMIFEPLIALNDTRDAVQSLAENWVYDQASNVYTIRIRSGVRWHHDRGEVTANDVAFTINTILQNPSCNYYTNVSKYIAQVIATDISTVKITPKIKSYALIYALNIPIISAAYYTGVPADTKIMPIGSGPYSVVGFVYSQNSHMELSINELWWKKQPYINKINVIGYKDNKSAVSAFMQGNLHCVPTNLLTTDVYTTFEGVYDDEYMSRYYDFLAPNLNNPLFQDKKVRQALSYAIDRKQIINTIYLNHAIIAEMPIPPDSLFVDTTVVRYDNNANKAKVLLQEAGWKINANGLLEKDGKLFTFEIITIDNADDPIRRETARAIAKQLKEYGMTVTVSTFKKEELETKITQKNFEMVLSGYYLSEIPSFDFAYRSNSAGNISGYKNTAMNALLDAMDNATTKEDYAKASSELQKFTADEIPQIGLFFRLQSLVYRTSLHPSRMYRDLSVYEGIDKWFLTENTQG